MKVTDAELTEVAALVEELCGVVLDQTKGYLVENRLGEIARKAGCDDYSQLVQRVRKGDDAWLRANLIDAITTNETLFFRDHSPFEALRHKVIPEMIDAKEKAGLRKRIRVWSSACSTGQEPYSIAMVLHDLIGDCDVWDAEILATDICDAALTQASAGAYGDFEIRRGLSDTELKRHFSPQGDTWVVNPALRSMVRFERRNLLAPFTMVGMFDIIFCRNVAIYFRPEARTDLYLRLLAQLAPGGIMFTSSSESLSGIDPVLVPEHHCRAVFYRPKG